MFDQARVKRLIRTALADQREQFAEIIQVAGIIEGSGTALERFAEHIAARLRDEEDE